MKAAFRFTTITLLLAASNLPGATLYVSLETTNPTPPYTNWVTAATNIQDAVDAATVGDEVVVSNGVYASGGRVVSGTMTNRVAITNAVTVRSFRGPQFTLIEGWQVPGKTNGDSAIRCVYLTNGATLSGFTLTNGATRIYDDFINHTTDQNCGGGVWCASTTACVSNCVIAGSSSYWEGGGAYGGTLCDCTLSGNFASNDHGGGAGRCTLYNCTLTKNWVGWDGGGAWECTLYNCMLTTNSAGTEGGGAWDSTLYNCTLIGNVANGGGGAYTCSLYDCTLTGNRSVVGGGAYGSSLYNCIVYSNSTGGNSIGSTLNYCCTTPLPTNGVGNISNAPLFIDYTNGNLHLQSDSPCINAGNNAYVTTTTDLDGNPRIVSGAVDIGAYEYQGTGSRISYAWLQQYGLPTDGSADFIDSDGDGMNNWQEWLCGTDPTDPLSVLRLLSPSITSTNVTVTWQSVAGVNYFLERSTNLTSPFTHLASFIMGQAGTTSYADTNVAGAGQMFYRVGVLPSGAN